MDARDLRQVFGLFATGVTVVTAYGKDGGPIGITANSFSSVSLDPPMVLWCLDNRSRHLPAFEHGAPFAIHILSESQADIALDFARSGASGLARLPEDRHAPPPHIDGAVARIECHVANLCMAGDHTIIIGEVVSTGTMDAPPLVFQKSRFGRFVPSQKLSGEESWHILMDMWS
ncbi:MAG: flavin reductase family protein [Hyphomonas sp.]|nr:flavin reductase family protein [Hyphomonas sp.]